MKPGIDRDSLCDFSVRGAQRCAAGGLLEAWVHTYLRRGSWANLPLSKGLKRKERFWVGPIEVPLEKIDRQCGPEEGMIYPEAAEIWEARIARLCSSIRDVLDLPPLIVNSLNGTHRNQDGSFRFMIADGSHRLEALKRMDTGFAHVLIWFETEEQREAYLRERRGCCEVERNGSGPPAGTPPPV